ncbi:DNA repair protein RecN [Microbacterium sediminicola]|uniref:DNA repair protein RecN n=1 Tax=Microbacterium sediminicola TaxID=415210 RepID=A0ABN2HZG8_9MICO
MIEQMRLRDLGVIADATLPLGPGFTAITGETGAGKTMVVTGLGLLMGARSDAGAVRAGAAQASVEGIWIVPPEGHVVDRVREAGGDIEPIDDGRAELVVSRTLSAEGRSRASVGGRSAPAGVLADLADQLVVVHGQSDQLRLRSAAAQRDVLDRFGGETLAAALAAYGEAFRHWQRVDTELETLLTEREDRAREADQLRAAIDEIEKIAPEPDEDVALAQRAARLAHSEELRDAATLAHELLAGEGEAPDAVSLLADARRTLERASGNDQRLQELADQLADLGYRMTDVSAELAGYLADLDDSGPQELAAVEERRSVLADLVRAHGTLAAALDLLATGSARLVELDDDDDRVVRLSAERDAATSALDAAAAHLTAARADAATRLAAGVTAEVQALAMPDARVEVVVSPTEPSIHGRDEVAILLAPHPGAQLRPVARGASGGELSRVMLALEVVTAGADAVPTFVFDEVDAGIGGAAAIEVGQRLAALAQTSQVIAVTHLAQVAAFAGRHLSVVKSSDGSVTESSVRSLEGPEREAEMARLLSGMPDSEAALTHARELLGLRTAPRPTAD